MTRAPLALCTVSLLAAAAFVACLDEDPRYVYTAQKYDPALGCLEDYAAVETVPGDSVSSVCPVTCLTANASVYLSTVCPPVPAIATALDAASPECQEALDAARLEASCSAPEEAEEGDGGGGAEDGEAPDAGADAPADLDTGAPPADAGDGG